MTAPLGQPPDNPVPPATKDDAYVALIPQAVSNLCSKQARREILLGYIVQFLRQQMHEQVNIEEQALRKFLWQPGEHTNILIDSLYSWKPQLTEKNPALIVKQNAFKNQRMGTGDQAGLDPQTNPQYATLWIGSYTVFAIHSSGAGVNYLATEAQRRLTQFGPKILSQALLTFWQVQEVGEISILEEAEQNMVIPITVGVAYQEIWTLREEALPLRRVTPSGILGT